MNLFKLFEKSDKKETPVQERNVMLDDKLDGLKGINGYKGAAITDYTGDLLLSDTGTLKGDLEATSATFNDIFRSAHKASNDLNLGHTEAMQIQTGDGIIMMACSGTESRAHIHIFVVLAADGNQALTRMELKKIVPKVVAELAS